MVAHFKSVTCAWTQWWLGRVSPLTYRAFYQTYNCVRKYLIWRNCANNSTWWQKI